MPPRGIGGRPCEIGWIVTSCVGHGVSDYRHPCRTVGLPPVRHGCEEWGVGLDQQTFARAQDSGLADFGSTLEGDDAAEREVSTEIETTPSFLRTAGEAVNDDPLGKTTRLQKIDRVVPCGPRVNNERQSAGWTPTRSAPRRPVAVRLAASGRSDNRGRTPPLRRRRPGCSRPAASITSSTACNAAEPADASCG